jgi:hypothetical protein
LLVSSLVAGIAAISAASAVAGEGCTQPDNPIETDRPDNTNSSIVVPFGSLQSENGINVSRRNGADVFDGTNSRWRLGVAPCFEVLIDLPNYVGAFHGRGVSGFGDVAPAVKWQVRPLPGKFDLSVVSGVALPTGARAVAGLGGGYNPTCNSRGRSNSGAVGPSLAW